MSTRKFQSFYQKAILSVSQHCHNKQTSYGFVASLTTVLCLTLSPFYTAKATTVKGGFAPSYPFLTLAQQSNTTSIYLEESRIAFEAGRFEDAMELLQQAIAKYHTQGDAFWKAIALRNLSLVYQHLGNWEQAQETISESLNLLQENPSPGSLEALAKALEVQGQLQMATGQFEQASETWQQAIEIYAQLNDDAGAILATLAQAEALQEMGFNRWAIDLLMPFIETLELQPKSRELAMAKRSLGDAYRGFGELNTSYQVLEESLVIAQELELSNEIAISQLSLGSTADALGSGFSLTAQEYYRQVVASTASDDIRLQANLNLLASLFNSRGLIQDVIVLIPQLSEQINQFSPSRTAVYGRIKFAQLLTEITAVVEESGGVEHIDSSIPSLDVAVQHLLIARQHAQRLSDQRTESLALGHLGKLYEQTEDWQIAQDFTQQALSLAKLNNAQDIAYQWHWQMGRILNAQNNREEAIAAYSSAVAILPALRNELISVNPDIQFSFRENIEPIHRELVELLLKENANPTPGQLRLAQHTIESLQLAELDNFFRDACLNSQSILIDEVDQKAAVIYPIMLPDRLEVIVTLPDQAISHHTQDLSTWKISQMVDQLFWSINTQPNEESSNSNFLNPAQDIYRWLIQPIEEKLIDSDVETLVFVSDGALRNIPMGVLHDGEHFLLETYNMAIAPGLQLMESPSVDRRDLNILLFGLSESHHEEFSALPKVIDELHGIQATVPNQTRIYINQDFTSEVFQNVIRDDDFSVIHLATHGYFGGDLDNMYILAWDNLIESHDFDTVLRAAELERRRPIDLLVLSACETASGSDRATLGLAGLAIRAGARSTVATLWQVSDESMSLLMTQFYEELMLQNTTKAEALRNAQINLINSDTYHHPFFWSATVLIGNWN